MSNLVTGDAASASAPTPADEAEAARLDAQAAEYTRLGLEAARQGRGTDAFRLREQAYWASKDAADLRAGTATSRQRRIIATSASTPAPAMSEADRLAHEAASYVRPAARSQVDEALDRAVAASPDRIRSPLPTQRRARRRVLDLREW